MKRTIWIIGLILCLAPSVYAQRSDTPTVEVFGGPSILRNGFTAPHYSLYGGWQAQASFNFNSYVGVTADFGGQYRNVLGVRVQQYEYMFGPRFTLRAQRATVFAHGLVGANTLRATGTSLHGFATGVGGGLDYNVGHHFAVRVIQADFLRTRLSNQWFNDARIGVGIVVKF